MTYRERRERKAERLREWADKRKRDAAAVFKRGEVFRGDYAFNTQPGHIPERARLIARENRAHESLQKAHSMASRAASIDSAADRAIYSDDPDAASALEERIAELEVQRDRVKEINKAAKAGQLENVNLTQEEIRDLIRAARFAPLANKTGGYPSYHLTNLSGNINKQKQRLKALRGDRSGQCSRCGMSEQSHKRQIACEEGFNA